MKFSSGKTLHFPWGFRCGTVLMHPNKSLEPQLIYRHWLAQGPGTAANVKPPGFIWPFAFRVTMNLSMCVLFMCILLLNSKIPKTGQQPTTRKKPQNWEKNLAAMDFAGRHTQHSQIRQGSGHFSWQATCMGVALIKYSTRSGITSGLSPTSSCHHPTQTRGNGAQPSREHATCHVG